MKMIFKYEVSPHILDITMPRGAEILCVQTQDGNPKIWAIVDPEGVAEIRHFAIYGTGHHMPDNPGKYIGTFQLSGGELVFHLFEVKHG